MMGVEELLSDYSFEMYRAVEEKEERKRQEKIRYRKSLRNNRIKQKLKKAAKYLGIGVLALGLWYAKDPICHAASPVFHKAYNKIESDIHEYRHLKKEFKKNAMILENDPGNLKAYGIITRERYLTPEKRKKLRKFGRIIDGNLFITARKNGIVEHVGHNYFFGGYIAIGFKDFWGTKKQMFYACLSDIKVEPFQKIRRGQTIAKAGRCFESEYFRKHYGLEGSYVHYELRENGVPRNPFLD